MLGTFGHSNTFAILTAFTAIPTQRKKKIGSSRELISHGISHKATGSTDHNVL